MSASRRWPHDDVVEAVNSAMATAGDVLRDQRVAQRWEGPSSLALMTVGGVAGHLYATVRHLQQVLEALAPTEAEVVDLAGYYGHARIARPEDLHLPLHEKIRADGARVAERGWEHACQRFATSEQRVRALLVGARAGSLVPLANRPGAAGHLDDYLATRVVELVVHADDLASSIGAVGWEAPPTAAALAVDVLIGLTRARIGDMVLVRALARAERAPDDVVRAL